MRDPPARLNVSPALAGTKPTGTSGVGIDIFFFFTSEMNLGGYCGYNNLYEVKHEDAQDILNLEWAWLLLAIEEFNL
jgi:hypothetical protein